MPNAPENFIEPLSEAAARQISIEFPEDREWWVEKLSALKMPLVFQSVSDLEALRRDAKILNDAHIAITKAIIALDRTQETTTLYGLIGAKKIKEEFYEHGENLVSLAATAFGTGTILNAIEHYMSKKGVGLRGSKMLAIGVAWNFHERNEKLTFGQTDSGEPSTCFCRIVKLMIDENGLHSHWRRASKFGIDFVTENLSSDEYQNVDLAAKFGIFPKV